MASSAQSEMLPSWFGRAAAAPALRDWAQAREPLTDDDVVLQSRTHVWLRGIPSGVHPKQLCRHYPRIANCVAAHWHDPLAVGWLLTELMVDRRGGRQGFPPRVAAEIVCLYRMHARRLAPTAG